MLSAPGQHSLLLSPWLQVDNADNRIVLLADPDSGAIVARVVVPPGGELPEDGFPWVVQAGAAGTAAAARDDDDEDYDDEEDGGRGCSPMIGLLVVACMLGGLAWLASSSEGGASGQSAHDAARGHWQAQSCSCQARWLRAGPVLGSTAHH